MVEQRPNGPLFASLVDYRDEDVTEIIPFNEFGASSGSGHGDHFSMDLDVLAAPELDDLNDLADETPLRLVGMSRAASRSRTKSQINDGSIGTERSPTFTMGKSSANLRPPGGRSHRNPIEVVGATRSRLFIAAMASGALAAGANAALNASEVQASPTVLAADVAALGGTLPQDASGVQIVQVPTTVVTAVHTEEMTRATAFANERAQREARLQRPLYVSPTRGILTSGFGTRWGTLHGGLDIANAIGTPVYSTSDGVVIAAGPTPGFGMWVKIRDAAGFVTLYGHIDTTTVQAGEKVMAGDQIATMGNRGNSTGPHLHFEVHQGGTDKIDPAAWLRQRGVASA